MICLNRLQITGPLPPTAPSCVIKEIADCHYIPCDTLQLRNNEYRSDMIAKVHSHNVPFVEDPSGKLSYDQWDSIARYVNPSGLWNWEPALLLRAVRFLQSFISEPKLPDNTDFPVGNQSPINIYSYNACILYKLCKLVNIPTYPETTIDEMAQIIRFQCLTVNELHDIIFSRINLYDKATLINILRLDQDFKKLQCPRNQLQGLTPVTFTDLVNCAESFRSAESLRLKLVPKTAMEAVSLAALNFKMDISEAQNPLVEYSLLSSSPDTYIPRDPALAKAIKLRPRALSLGWNFNPVFPMTYYNEDDLTRMAKNEGYTNEDLAEASSYELLQLAYLRPTFYAGIYPEVQNLETPIYTDLVAELDPEQILCYGIRKNPMIALRYAELADCFKHNKNFRNPLVRDEYFDMTCIRKLKHLANLPSTEASKEERKQLLHAIRETELYVDVANEKALQFYQAYSNADNELKEKIHKLLQTLLELGMSCRGWLGHGPYPVRVAPEPTIDIQGLVDQQVTGMLHKLDQVIADLPDELAEMFLTLPLIGYRGNYYASSDITKGLTIRDRVNLVRQGENISNVEGCIRLSSNWICASAHRYMTTLGLDEPFDIDQLRPIS